MKTRSILFGTWSLALCFALLGGWLASAWAQDAAPADAIDLAEATLPQAVLSTGPSAALSTGPSAALSTGPSAALSTGPSAALSTGFTFQGNLTDGGSPANGSYDLRFILYDAAEGGSQVGSIVVVDDLAVNGGPFTAALDFGSAVFTGAAL